MKILILGHTGFLGSAVFNALQENRALSVIGKSKSSGFDLRDFEETSDTINTISPDVVINCASFVGGLQFGLANKSDIYFNNMLMNISLFKALEKSSVKKIIHPMSNCTYPHKFELYEEDKWWDGRMHDSVEIYGFTKKASYIAASAIKNSTIESVQLVFPNLYGPNDHISEIRAHALGALCMKFVRADINNQNNVSLWGTGRPVREWLYVNDAAEAINLSIFVDLPSEPINISTALGLSIYELAQKIQSLVNTNIEIVTDPSKEDGAYSKLLKPSRWVKGLGWAPKMNIDQGLQKTITYYKEKLSCDS